MDRMYPIWLALAIACLFTGGKYWIHAASGS